MARIDKEWKRRIRIEGKQGKPFPHDVVLYDAETGEKIANVTNAVIELGVGHENRITVTYANYDGNGLVEGEVTLDNPDISNIVAFEKGK